MDLRQLVDPFFQIIQQNLNELNGNLPHNVNDEEKDGASNLKLLR